MFEVGQRVKVVQLLDEGLEPDVFARYIGRVGAIGEVAFIDTGLSGERWYEVRFNTTAERLHTYEFLPDELEAVDDV